MCSETQTNLEAKYRTYHIIFIHSLIRPFYPNMTGRGHDNDVATPSYECVDENGPNDIEYLRMLPGQTNEDFTIWGFCRTSTTTNPCSINRVFRHF